MQSESIMQRIRDIGLEEVRKDNLPPLIYTQLAIEKGIELSRKFKADPQVIEAALWLGDSRLGPCIRENRIPDHVKESMDFAKVALKEAGASKEFIEKAVQAMSEHHSTKHKTIEGEIVANADGYKFLQPVGLFYLLCETSKKKSYVDALKYALGKLEEKWNTLTILECKKEMEQNYKTLKFVLESAIEKASKMNYK